MKPHHSEAPEAVRRSLSSILSRGIQRGNRNSPAMAWLAFVNRATQLGYRVDEAEVPQDATRKLAELKADTAELLKFSVADRAWLANEARTEQATLTKVRGLAQSWAKGPTREEEATAARAALAERQRVEAIERRTQEIIEQKQAKALEDARKQAAKEIAQ